MTRLSDGFIYVVASRKQSLYIARGVRAGVRGLALQNYSRFLYDARLFFTKAEAFAWCEGRRGWRPVKIGTLTAEYMPATINSGFTKPRGTK